MTKSHGEIGKNIKCPDCGKEMNEAFGRWVCRCGRTVHMSELRSQQNSKTKS